HQPGEEHEHGAPVDTAKATHTHPPGTPPHTHSCEITLPFSFAFRILQLHFFSRPAHRQRPAHRSPPCPTLCTPSSTLPRRTFHRRRGRSSWPTRSLCAS